VANAKVVTDAATGKPKGDDSRHLLWGMVNVSMQVCVCVRVCMYTSHLARSLILDMCAGYGFVRFFDENEAKRAITELNGQFLMSRYGCVAAAERMLCGYICYMCWSDILTPHINPPVRYVPPLNTEPCESAPPRLSRSPRWAVACRYPSDICMLQYPDGVMLMLFWLCVL